MADSFCLFDYFLMRLIIGPPGTAIAVRPAHIEHKFSEIKIARVTGCPVEFRQPHLGDLVTRPDRLLTRTEGPVEKFSSLERNVEQRTFSRRLVVGNGGFVEVPEIVQFVAVNFLEL